MKMSQIHARTIYSASAVYSLNQINIITPPLRITFGRYNQRDVDKKEAQNLARAIQKQFDPYNDMSMIPIELEPDDIEESCVNRTTNSGSGLPELKLTAKGMKNESIEALGGQHRKEAVEIIGRELIKRIQALEKRLAKERLRKAREADLDPNIETLSAFNTDDDGDRSSPAVEEDEPGAPRKDEESGTSPHTTGPTAGQKCKEPPATAIGAAEQRRQRAKTVPTIVVPRVNAL